MIHRRQEGMAALVVTVILISLLSAVAVAFAVVMNRELQKSVDNQLGQAAYNAAASGINDSISFLRDNPNTNVTQCSDLIGTGKPLSAASNLSGDGSTKYTCVLINSRPLDLVYQSIASNQSQVLKTSFSAPAGKIMFSWQATNRAYSNFVPAAQAGQLFDETAWYAAKYAPMLKVSLYPIPADTQDAGYALSNSKTYYLYPQKPVGFSVNTLSYATQAGTLVPVECGLKNLNGAFNGTPDYDCSLIINNLPSSNPSGYMYYVRLTPIYGAADVKIRANDTTGASTPVSFLSTQAIVDVTAKSASAVKRLQARVDISGINGTSQNISSTDNAFPESALRSANTVCKRLYNTGTIDLPAYIDAVTINYCGSDQSGLNKLIPPTVSGSCSDGGNYSDANCSFSINPQNGRITYCKLLIDGSEKADCMSLFPPTHTDQIQTLSGTYSLGSGDHSYSLCADNPAGRSAPCATGTFNIPTPTPPPAFLSSFTQDTTCVYGGVRHGNCYNFTGNNLAAWPCTYTIDGGTGNGYSLNADGTAGSFTYGNDGVVAGSGNITCGSASCALNSTDCTNVPPVPGGGGVSVAIGIPSGFGQYAFSWSVTLPNAPNDCRDDAHHTFIGCFNITASQNGDYSKIERCAVNTDTGNAYSYGLSAYSTFHRASPGHWIDVTVGWPGSALWSNWSATGGFSLDQRGMPGADGNGNATVSVTCYAFDGTSGSSSQSMHWDTCYDVGKRLNKSWEGTYYSDQIDNGCARPARN